jgi:hypothetical protein
MLFQNKITPAATFGMSTVLNPGTAAVIHPMKWRGAHIDGMGNIDGMPGFAGGGMAPRWTGRT